MAKGKLAPYHIEKGLTISPGKGFLLHLEKMPPNGNPFNYNSIGVSNNAGP